MNEDDEDRAETVGDRIAAEPDDLPSDRLHGYLVQEVMTRPAYTVGRSWSLLAAAESMREHRISGFPVVDEDLRVVGVLSEKDIVRALDAAAGLGRARSVIDLLLSASGRGRADLIETYLSCLKRTHVADAMTSRPVVIDAEAVLVEAAQLFRRNDVNRLPVVDGSGRLVGILARQDLIRTIAKPVPKRARRSGRRAPRAPRRAARRMPTQYGATRSRGGPLSASRARGAT